MVNLYLVEDDPKLKDLYNRILTKQGYTILDTANDGEEAIKKYLQAKTRPDIIIIDQRLPNKTGLETIEDIKKIGTKTKFILATADHSLKDVREKLNVDAVLFKPFSIKLLINTIKKLNP